MSIYRATANTAVILAIFMFIYVGFMQSQWLLAIEATVSLIITAVLFTGLHEIVTHLKAIRAEK